MTSIPIPSTPTQQTQIISLPPSLNTKITPIIPLTTIKTVTQQTPILQQKKTKSKTT